MGPLEYKPTFPTDAKVKLDRCRHSVTDAWRSHQCARKPVVNGKWCKQHSPEAYAEKYRKSEERAQKWRDSIRAETEKAQRARDIESCLREILECDKESDFGINDECIFFRDEESWSKSERLKAALDKARELVNAQSARSQT